MKRRLLALLLAAPMILPFGLAEAQNAYIPFDKPDQWTYKNTRFGQTTTANVDMVSGGWKHFTEFGGMGAVWVWPSTVSNKFWVWNGQTHELMADLDAPVGTSYHITLGFCNTGDVTIGARNETVATAAGVFTGCVRLDLGTNCADAGLGTIWFAPGVGIVKWAEGNITGTVFTELESGVIGGTTYPQAGGFETCVKVASTNVTVDLEPTTGAYPITTLQVELTVTNNGPQPVTFQFSSGQQFDVAVLDANDNVVARWSEGRFFTMAFTSFTLNQGESRTFTAQMPFNKADGTAVPTGWNRVRMYLVDYSGKAVGSEAPVNVHHAL